MGEPGGGEMNSENMNPQGICLRRSGLPVFAGPLSIPWASQVVPRGPRSRHGFSSLLWPPIIPLCCNMWGPETALSLRIPIERFYPLGKVCLIVGMRLRALWQALFFIHMFF
jgi:hypothetical protein